MWRWKVKKYKSLNLEEQDSFKFYTDILWFIKNGKKVISPQLLDRYLYGKEYGNRDGYSV